MKCIGLWEVPAQTALFKLRVYNNQTNKAGFSLYEMNLCYNEQFLQQFVPSYTYYLAYLPTFSAQNYGQSTFTPVPLQDPQVPLYSYQNLVQARTLQPLAHQGNLGGISGSKKNYAEQKGAVIQPFSQNKKDEDNSGKAIQKQSRNVLSNLLRILFKNILEVRMYDEIIDKIITFHHFATTVDDFYQWLEGYGVNYKNYIRFCSVKRIMSSKKRKDHLIIFRVILKEYIKVAAITHCLTSKRIDRASMSMHLEGLRQLKKDLLSE